jgi:hypothetical protein
MNKIDLDALKSKGFGFSHQKQGVLLVCVYFIYATISVALSIADVV